MIEYLIPATISVAISILFILFFKKSDNQFRNIFLLIAGYHLIYTTLLFLPIELSFQIPDTSMNWTGKILAILFSISFYKLNADKLANNDFVKGSVVKGSLKKIMLVGGIVLIVMCLLTLTFSKGKPLDFERLAYQLTMPGIDEELWRGILLGLIIPLIKGDRFKMGHPAVWAVTIIFALAHSLYLTDWKIGFAADAFIVSGVLGYILGWTILRSKSILPALILHNLINFSTNLLEMISYVDK